MRRFSVLVALVLVVTGLTSCSRATLSTPHLRSDWKTVTYRGVGTDVPQSWVVKAWHPSCGVVVPTVLLGPQTPSLGRCLRDTSGAAEVILGALPADASGATSRSINGLPALLVTTSEFFHGGVHASGGRTQVWVDLSRRGLWISVSVGDASDFPGVRPAAPNRSCTQFTRQAGRTIPLSR
jgi:hypothetical protein